MNKHSSQGGVSHRLLFVIVAFCLALVTLAVAVGPAHETKIVGGGRQDESVSGATVSVLYNNAVPLRLNFLPNVPAMENSGTEASLAWQPMSGLPGGPAADGSNQLRLYDAGSPLLPEGLSPHNVATQNGSAQSGEWHANIDGQGQVWMWVETAEAIDSEDEATSRPVPAKMQGLPPVTTLALGGGHAVALTSGGEVWAWELAPGAYPSGAAPPGHPMKLAGLPEVISIGAWREYGFAKSGDGAIWIWQGVENKYAALSDEELAAAIGILTGSTPPQDAPQTFPAPKTSASAPMALAVAKQTPVGVATTLFFAHEVPRPENLRVEVDHYGFGILLEWEGLIGEDGMYVIERSDGEYGPFQSINKIEFRKEGEPRYACLDDKWDGRSCKYRVYAMRFSDGAISDCSNEEFLHVPPHLEGQQRPNTTHIMAEAQSWDSVLLRMEIPSGEGQWPDIFRLFRVCEGEERFIGHFGAWDTQFTDQYLQGGKTYIYQIRSDFEHYHQIVYAETVVSTPERTLETPCIIAGVVESSSTFRIIWQESAHDGEFEIERCGADGVFSQLACIGGYATSWVDACPGTGGPFTYRVRARAGKHADNAVSPWSNVVSTPRAAAPRGADLWAQGYSDGYMILYYYYTATSPDVEAYGAYEWERKIGDGDFEIISTPQRYRNDVNNFYVMRDWVGSTGITCTYRVRAKLLGSISDYSQCTVQMPTGFAPQPLFDVQLRGSFSGSEISLIWDNGVNAGIPHFLERRIGSGVFENIYETTFISFAIKDGGFLPGEVYTYRVRKENGIARAYSNEVAVIGPTGPVPPPPARPADLTASAGREPGALLLEWKGTNPSVRHEIERKGPEGYFYKVGYASTLDYNRYIDDKVVSGNTYTYRIRAERGGQYSDYSDEAVVVALESLDTPTGFAANPVSWDAVKLTWNMLPDTGVLYELERRALNGCIITTTRLADGLAINYETGVVAFTDHGLVANSIYEYRLRAIKGYLKSYYTAVVSAWTPSKWTAPPPLPANLSAKSVTDTTITLAWTGSSDAAVIYEIERSSDGGLTYEKIAEISGLSYVDTGLVPGDTYHYRILARNYIGASAYTDALSATTIFLPQPPAAPSSLTATAVSQSTVLLTWTASPTGNATYELERKTGDGAFAKVADIVAGTTSHTDSSLTAGTTYIYRLRAMKAGLASDYTQDAIATTERESAIPTVRITSPETDTEIAWDESIDITVEAACEGGEIVRVEIYRNGMLLGTADAAPYVFVLANVQPGEWMLAARAITADGLAAWSSTVKLVVPAAGVGNHNATLSPSYGATVSEIQAASAGIFALALRPQAIWQGRVIATLENTLRVDLGSSVHIGLDADNAYYLEAVGTLAEHPAQTGRAYDIVAIDGGMITCRGTVAGKIREGDLVAIRAHVTLGRLQSETAAALEALDLVAFNEGACHSEGNQPAMMGASESFAFQPATDGRWTRRTDGSDVSPLTVIYPDRAVTVDRTANPSANPLVFAQAGTVRVWDAVSQPMLRGASQFLTSGNLVSLTLGCYQWHTGFRETGIIGSAIAGDADILTIGMGDAARSYWFRTDGDLPGWRLLVNPGEDRASDPVNPGSLMQITPLAGNPESSETEVFEVALPRGN